jgi:stage V sporulation protein R
MYSKFMRGGSLLTGSNTVPGQTLTAQEKEIFTKTLKICSDYGCDYYPTVVQKLTYDEMSEVAAYGGFPRRFPHWKWGMEYEELQRGYEYGMHRIYEMVINTNPCYIYILNSNTLLDNVTVVAHATFHNDFFKNNIRFTPTSQNMMNKLANHGSRIQKYMDRWGIEKVTEFIDHVIRIQTLIDVAKAWDTRTIQDHIIRDSREYEHPRRLNVDEDRMHMDPWINTKGWADHENERIRKLEQAKEMGLFQGDDKDIFGFIKNAAPLKPWQADIVSMLYEEAMYFAPQRATKTLNEGWASFGDYEIMTRQGHVGLGQKSHDAGIIEYSLHKMGVLGGKYSMNPYKLGFYLLLDIEERWNKGQFGQEWEDCKDLREKENWDKNLGLGKQKVFEVRKYYDDLTFIHEFFTQDFCDKFEFFEWRHYPNGEYRIETRDAKRIKRKLLQRHLNGGLPDIRLVDPNHRGRGWLLLQHQWDGRLIHEPYTREVMASLYYLWGREVILATKDKDDQEVVFVCVGTDADKDIALITRQEYESKW